MKHKKYSWNLYQVHENDALKDELEQMAKKGWRLVKVGSSIPLLTFEACDPHPIRYCVEVMEKPSTFASNQTLPLKRYREFCKDAGWDYLGTNGLLHIFCTEDMETPDVETDPQERFERIVNACKAVNRSILLLFTFIILINLIPCWVKRTLLCSQGLVAAFLLLVEGYYIGEYWFWKRRALASLSGTGSLPRLSCKSVRMKNSLIIAVVLILCALLLLYTIGGSRSSAVIPFLMLYLAVYVVMLLFFGRLLHWLREKKDFSPGVNKLIYWGAGAFMVILILLIISVFLKLYF